MGQYFPKPYELFGADINVKVDLSNYATKADLKDATGIDTSNFALKSNLASLKTEVDKLDIDQLVPVPVDLSKLSDVVKNDVIKKTVIKSKISTSKFSNDKLKNLNKKNNSSKTKHLRVENELKNFKNFIQVILEAGIILKVMMVLKIN